MLIKNVLAAALVAGVSVGVAPQAQATVFDICPSGRAGVIEGTPTSCPFADNVRVAWFSQPGNPVRAYSPVTGQFYVMTCVRSTENVGGMTVNGFTCFGGNNAEVVVWS